MKLKLLLLLFISWGVYAQDLEKLAKMKPKDLLKGKGLSIAGNVSANHRYYIPDGIPNRLVNFQYIYSGRVNFDLFGKVKIPLTFSFTNQKATFGAVSLRGSLPTAQPFNRLNLKPTYKGHTLQIGTCALTYSPFTLAGFRYTGIGYEYKSKKFPVYGSAMYGTMLKPIRIDSINNAVNNKPAYKRMGISGKLGYQHNDDFIELSILNAFDEVKSLPYRLDAKGIFPESNVALSVGFQKVLYKKFYLKSELGRSHISRQLNPLKAEQSFGRELIGLLAQSKNRVFKQAVKAGLEYKEDKKSIGFEYSRIDPKYKTLGAYFFNNDIETFALKSGIKLKEDKLSLNGDIGHQRFNLDLANPQTQKRWVWNLVANYAPSEKVNLSANYSTFTSFSNFQNQFLYLKAIDPFQELDTLNYRQVNQTIGGNMLFQLPKKGNFKQSLSTNILFQTGADAQGNSNKQNNLGNISLNYGLNQEEKKIVQNFGVNFIQNETDFSKDKMWGPMYSINYPILKDKIKLNSTWTYTSSKTSMLETKSILSRNILLGTFGLQTAIKKKHNISFTTMYLKTANPNSKTKAGENFSELTFNLGYNYSFKLLDLKFK
jgi:hypothetical protein